MNSEYCTTWDMKIWMKKSCPLPVLFFLLQMKPVVYVARTGDPSVKVFVVCPISYFCDSYYILITNEIEKREKSPQTQ